MKSIEKQAVTLVNVRNGETWRCDDYRNRRIIDGAEFIEVYNDLVHRKVWINSANLQIKGSPTGGKL